MQPIGSVQRGGEFTGSTSASSPAFRVAEAHGLLAPPRRELERVAPLTAIIVAAYAGLFGADTRATEPLEWTRLSTAPFRPERTAYGNGLWVARGSNREGPVPGLHISADLLQWQKVLNREFPMGWVMDFVYAGGSWVAVGSGGLLASSPDGRNWTAHDLGFPRYNLRAVTYGNGTWAAAGGTTVADSGRAAILSSVGGQIWTPHDLPGLGDLSGVFHASGAWVAVGDGALVASTDARTWTTHKLGGEGRGTYTAAYGSGTWLVLGWYPSPKGLRLGLWHSADAQTWTFSAPDPPELADGDVTSCLLHFANGLWLMARGEAGGSSLWASSDARRWTQVFNGGWIWDLLYADGAWVAVGDSIFTSTDGISWRTHRMGDEAIAKVHFADGTWVAWGNGGEIYVARTQETQVPQMVVERKLNDRSLDVSCRGPRDYAYRLQRSDDLRDWTEIAVAHQRLAAYPIPDSRGQAFYRTLVSPLTPGDDWKNQIAAAGTAEAAGEPFLSAASPQKPWEHPRWIKFALPLDEPGRVYFQDSSKYVFHFEFAQARLPRFASMSVAEFEAIALHREGQRVVLGALLFPPSPLVPEIGIQFVGDDAFPPEQVAEWFHRVRSRVVIPGVTFYYLPVFEQMATAGNGAAELAARGVPVSSLDRWVAGDQCYSRGWALGRLVYLRPADIPAAYADGRLRAADILLTDTVPAEVPPVAGILSLSPAAPNSHVVILAQSTDVPFGFVADPAERTQLLGWKGEEILLMVYPSDLGGFVKAAKVWDGLSSDLRQRLLELKQVAPLDIAAKASMGRLAVPVDGLDPEDIQYVGGKAANFGVLARSIPENAPAGGIAFTFDLWDGFMNQAVVPGKTLRQAIEETLAGWTGVPADLTALTHALAMIRRMIAQDADFNAEQKRAILEALSGFDPRRNLRFRSSTNVEDTEAFTGAGLYDSYSGCLADDLDNDERGPSQCDPTENNERGVFRALRKVYASFYNDNAFLERRRRGVREADVAMGVLVHLSAPDEIEWANGVATLSVTQAQDPVTRTVSARLVTQAGAVSVANPEAHAKPEIITAEWTGLANIAWAVEQPSGLVQLGARVLEWPKDYEALLGLLDTAARAYAALFPARHELMLDFEYKKLEPGRLTVKQVREIPRPRQTAPLLIPDAGEIVVLQYSRPMDGNFENPVMDVWANHRLKSSWRFLPSPLAPGVVTAVRLRDGDAVQTLVGSMDSFPEAQMSIIQDRVQYAFVRGEGTTRHTVRLNLVFPWDLEQAPPPFVFLSDAVMDLQVDYATPQTFFDWQGLAGSRTKDMAYLEPKSALEVGVTPCTFRLSMGSLTIESEVDWWSLHETSYRGDWYTLPVSGFRGTRLVGLASQPIVLRSDFAQSFFTYHHSWSLAFLFEPGMEPGMEPQILAELRAANIKAVEVRVGTFGIRHLLEGLVDVSTRSEVRILGYDGTLRAW